MKIFGLGKADMRLCKADMRCSIDLGRLVLFKYRMLTIISLAKSTKVSTIGGVSRSLCLWEHRACDADRSTKEC